MTRPRLEACYFAGADRRWERMARVLAMTAQEQCRGWDVNVEAIQPGAVAMRSTLPRTIAANTRKLERWTELVTASQDGDRLLLMDADTMVLRPIDDVWDEAFDLAYTTRHSGRFPLNGGVLFVRVSHGIRAFFARWCDENTRMLHDRAHHATWQRRYAGINQAAFG